MLRVRLPLALLLVGLLAIPAFAADDEAPTSASPMAKAESLMKEGKVKEARDAYIDAAKDDPTNEELVARAMVLSRVLKLETFVTEEEPSPVWERAICALHAFYHRENMAEKALVLDTAAHTRADSSTTACLVGESLLELGHNEKAVAFFDGLREGQKDEQVSVLEGISLGRVGRTDDAKEAASLVDVAATKDAGLLFDVARLQALTGQQDAALKTLTSSFEMCPPKMMKALRSFAMETPDFTALRTHEAFAGVMKTESKVSADGCGGCGSAAGCGGCGSASDCDKEECDKEGDGAGAGGCNGNCPEKSGEKGCCGGSQGGEKPAREKRGCGSGCGGSSD